MINDMIIWSYDDSRQTAKAMQNVDNIWPDTRWWEFCTADEIYGQIISHEIVIVLCTRSDSRHACANLKYIKAFLLFVNQTPSHGIRVSNYLLVLIAHQMYANLSPFCRWWLVITLLVRYEMVSLSLHETNPGHHLQSSYSIEQSDWPMFRKVKNIDNIFSFMFSLKKVMEDRIYSQAPSRFPINTAYVEVLLTSLIHAIQVISQK